MNDGVEKKCKLCGEVKSVDEFHPHRATKDKLQGYCKPCNITYKRKYAFDRKKIRIPKVKIPKPPRVKKEKKPYSPPKYRVIILTNCNGVTGYKTTLYRCNTPKSAYKKFHKLISENKVVFPKKTINYREIKSVEYRICVTKITEETDKPRELRNVYGKLYTEAFLKDWTILASNEYDFEETFWVWDMPKRGRERPTIHDIVKKLMLNAYTKNLSKQILVCHNKLVIFNEVQFDMVLCKNKEEAQRLHHTLYKITKKLNLRSLVFFGTASPQMIDRLYDIIHEHTGWSYLKIMRFTTRP